jgi:hypothetical protein
MSKPFQIVLVCYAAIVTGVIMAMLMTLPISIEDQYRSKGAEVRSCVDSGGEWYNIPGWGESCNFDTRKDNT